MGKGTTEAGTSLTFDLWHPNCWAIHATEELPGGILTHAVYDTPMVNSSTVNGLFTAYGDSEAEVEALIGHIGSSPWAVSINELPTSFETHTQRITPREVSREFFLEHDPTNMICPHLLEHGFIHSGPGKIEGGREYWDVRFAGERCEIESEIETICAKTGADIDIARIGSVGDESQHDPRNHNTLTQCQREVIDLARECGYYEWPREVSTRELADELDITKTTLLEHLRKAETKLLDP